MDRAVHSARIWHRRAQCHGGRPTRPRGTRGPPLWCWGDRRGSYDTISGHAHSLRSRTVQKIRPTCRVFLTLSPPRRPREHPRDTFLSTGHPPREPQSCVPRSVPFRCLCSQKVPFQTPPHIREPPCASVRRCASLAASWIATDDVASLTHGLPFFFGGPRGHAEQATQSGSLRRQVAVASTTSGDTVTLTASTAARVRR